MSLKPDPDAMRQFCDRALPGMLTEACDVPVEESAAIADDVLQRAEAMAALDQTARQVISAPFFEESFDHDPADASPWLKAVTTVVVRNSALEVPHTRGVVNVGGIKAITTFAAGPLSHLLASAPGRLGGGMFGGLAARYPRAWSALEALRGLLVDGGGRASCRLPVAASPELPTDDELVDAPTATAAGASSGFLRQVVCSGIDPRFDRALMAALRTAETEPGFVFVVSALSRISRNSEKLCRVLEFLLACDARVLTTNCLIAADAVYLRRSHLVRPDSTDPVAGLTDQTGISGVHRKTIQTCLRQAASPA
ncbi:hypothetical protein AB1484_31445 [Parafrankia sp. FMc6]|uniref:hypothetical protein n=1 Tax=Parafrankia soli TaxID=2599596 RepID=UPI0034D47990